MTRVHGACRYSFSSYKCWGPHAAALYGSHEAFEALGERGKGPNHFFIPTQQHVYKARTGGSGQTALHIHILHNNICRVSMSCTSPCLRVQLLLDASHAGVHG